MNISKEVSLGAQEVTELSDKWLGPTGVTACCATVNQLSVSSWQQHYKTGSNANSSTCSRQRIPPEQWLTSTGPHQPALHASACAHTAYTVQAYLVSFEAMSNTSPLSLCKVVDVR